MKPLGNDQSKPRRFNFLSRVGRETFSKLVKSGFLTVYDNQTRSLIQTDNPFPGITSKNADNVKNADGSHDI